MEGQGHVVAYFTQAKKQYRYRASVSSIRHPNLAICNNNIIINLFQTVQVTILSFICMYTVA